MKRYNRSASLPGSFTERALTAINHRSTPSDSSEIPEDNHHLIDRHAVVEVICRLCCTRQSSKTNTCVSCGVKFGEYHCSICNLWMSDEERPYHCADCGFCRVGGQENFQHCDQCGMCIDRVVFSDHNCKADKYRSNCPVCQEYLFSSRAASHEMPCGHAIHWDCFRQLATHDSRCPFCKKTAETIDRMMPIWDEMTECIALQPVPPELARVVNITCIDCECTENDLAWHFLGVRCNQCLSFNTVVDKIVLQGQEAHEFLKQNLASERRRKNRLKPTPSSRSDRSNEENPVNRRRSIL
jgi:RING finger and CHY zinc finger domain-containing protein 1